MELLQISFDLSEKYYGKQGQLDSPIVEMIFPRDKAEELANLPGLKWKLWTIQPEKCRAAGFYLFQTKADAQSHAAFAIKNYPKVPGLTNVSVEICDVMESLSNELPELQLTYPPIQVLRNDVGFLLNPSKLTNCQLA